MEPSILSGAVCGWGEAIKGLQKEAEEQWRALLVRRL